ncbi:sterol desaturase family protein [Altererythrobacter sp. B11]|uniref:sterol desaturase family protein n=1 Tax=Altererythrobacter sp. B11 TaxID=2060312 RepID=UPI001E31F2C8|nr:sterol desaturase family protein [Altererythrobacter sp. B11]
MFKNERLERLTLISPRVFALSWAILLPLIAFAGWTWSPPQEAPFQTVGWIALGLIVWTLFEYAMHRYLFHLDSDVTVLRWLVFLMHGNHHDQPGDALRGLMPLPVSVAVGGLVWLVLLALMGTGGTWVFLGFMSGYVMYDTLHFACHQWPMRSRIGMALKRHHMQHHYLDEDSNFAISAIFWDRVFGSNIKSAKR